MFVVFARRLCRRASAFDHVHSPWCIRTVAVGVGVPAHLRETLPGVAAFLAPPAATAAASIHHHHRNRTEHDPSTTQKPSTTMVVHPTELTKPDASDSAVSGMLGEPPVVRTKIEASTFKRLVELNCSIDSFGG